MYICNVSMAGAVIANQQRLLYITVPRECELYQYVTPLQSKNVMIGPWFLKVCGQKRWAVVVHNKFTRRRETFRRGGV